MSEIVYDECGRQWVQHEDGTRYPVTGYAGQTKLGFMCATDFEHELGAHIIKRDGKLEGLLIYDSLEELTAARSCIEECGWVRLLIVATEFGGGQKG